MIHILFIQSKYSNKKLNILVHIDTERNLILTHYKDRGNIETVQC